MYTVAEVVGHQKGDLGLSMTSRYAGRETLEAKAALRQGREAAAPRPHQEEGGVAAS